MASNQYLTDQFPTHPNREFFCRLTGELNRPIREIFAVISRQMLEVAEADLDLEAGFVHVKGAPGMPQIARRVC